FSQGDLDTANVIRRSSCDDAIRQQFQFYQLHLLEKASELCIRYIEDYAAIQKQWNALAVT
ncbi:hypothetical protein HN51_046192, partial [Arachis hypogaea]